MTKNWNDPTCQHCNALVRWDSTLKLFVHVASSKQECPIPQRCSQCGDSVIDDDCAVLSDGRNVCTHCVEVLLDMWEGTICQECAYCGVA